MNPASAIPSEPKEIVSSSYHEVIAWELRAAIRRYFEYWEYLFWKEQRPPGIYLAAIEQRRLPVVVFSCMFLENVINFYLCTKCDAKDFKKVESESLYKKWTKIPSQFAPRYLIRDTDQIGIDLRKLVNRRNAIIHSKPMLSIDGDNRHQGNEPDVQMDEHKFMEQCATLPYVLIHTLIHYDPSGFMAIDNVRMWCASILSEFERLDNRFKARTAIPRELIQEIMEQGHDRETAIQCGLQLRIDHKPNDSGLIELWVGVGKKIELKPVKFFQK